jgi:hypothetical protein
MSGQNVNRDVALVCCAFQSNRDREGDWGEVLSTKSQCLLLNERLNVVCFVLEQTMLTSNKSKVGRGMGRTRKEVHRFICEAKKRTG